MDDRRSISILNIIISVATIWVVWYNWDTIQPVIAYYIDQFVPKEYVINQTPAAPGSFPTPAGQYPTQVGPGFNSTPIVSTPVMPDLPIVTNPAPFVGEPVIVVEPTYPVYPTLDPNPTPIPPQVLPSITPFSPNYWCMYSNVWIEYIDFWDLPNQTFWGEKKDVHLERIVDDWGNVHFRAWPLMSVWHQDGIAYAHHPVCINNISNVPPLENVDGLGSPYSGQSRYINLEISMSTRPECPIDPMTGIGCKGELSVVALGKGLYAYPVNTTAR
jgi:hypothetical protein